MPVISQYSAVEPVILASVQTWFYDGPFFQTLRQGGLDRPGLIYFTVQYGHYSRQFPRVLGAAISAMAPDADWWIPLADNLWDEAGRGLPGKSHQALYQTFMNSVEPNLDPQRFPMGPAVTRAVDTFLTFFRQARPLEAMAAVGLGSELFAGTVMGWILDGLQHPRYQAPHPLDLGFWQVHVDRDEPRHYALCKTVLEPAARVADLPTLVDIGLDIARSEAEMYTGILQEIIAHTTNS